MNNYPNFICDVVFRVINYHFAPFHWSLEFRKKINRKNTLSEFPEIKSKKMPRRTSARKAQETVVQPQPPPPLTPVRQPIRTQKTNKTINDEITSKISSCQDFSTFFSTSGDIVFQAYSKK